MRILYDPSIDISVDYDTSENVFVVKFPTGHSKKIYESLFWDISISTETTSKITEISHDVLEILHDDKKSIFDKWAYINSLGSEELFMDDIVYRDDILDFFEQYPSANLVTMEPITTMISNTTVEETLEMLFGKLTSKKANSNNTIQKEFIQEYIQYILLYILAKSSAFVWWITNKYSKKTFNGQTTQSIFTKIKKRILYCVKDAGWNISEPPVDLETQNPVIIGKTSYACWTVQNTEGKKFAIAAIIDPELLTIQHKNSINDDDITVSFFSEDGSLVKEYDDMNLTMLRFVLKNYKNK